MKHRINFYHNHSNSSNLQTQPITKIEQYTSYSFKNTHETLIYVNRNRDQIKVGFMYPLKQNTFTLIDRIKSFFHSLLIRHDLSRNVFLPNHMIRHFPIIA